MHPFFNGSLFEIWAVPTTSLSFGIINCTLFAAWFIMALLTDEYLQLKKYLPKWRKIFFTITILNLLLEIIDVFVQLIIGDQFTISSYYQVTFFSHTWGTIILQLLLLTTGVLALIKNQPNAKFFLFAFFAILAGAIVAVIHEFNPFSFHFHADIPTAVSFLLLSFGLARQFKALQDERIAAEKQNALARQLRDIEIKEKERLQELDQFKTQLYTNITHEFRTPLTVISGISDQIKNQPEEKKLIQRNSQQLLDLVNQMLDLNKIDSGHLTPHWIQTDIIFQIKYLSESYRSPAESQNKRFNLQILEDSLWMDTDPQMLERILSNLVHNAIKFSPEGGQISLRVARSTTGFCQITVQDTGKGIPTDQLHKIFDRFYQVDHTTTRQGEGTGIGLALVKELTELLEGKVSVNSILNQATIFTIELPIRQIAEIKTWVPESMGKKRVPIEKVNKQPSATKKEKKELPKILIIEDHPDVRIYLTRLLVNNYQLLEADNGKSGLSQAFDQIPDLIISDIMMPQMDGLQLCQQIKNDGRTSHIPVILLTAKSTQDDRIQGLEEGADAYLTKPFDKKELYIRIEKLLENREKLQLHYQRFQMLPNGKSRKIHFWKKSEIILKIISRTKTIKSKILPSTYTSAEHSFTEN
ncbi:MAG: hybrid sensor histidine kinase/response regulator [Saprospiraceae bacterium]|nr:hybrid sensor histidine kinase/response regulator [Saprospiraceae bacterium]